MKAALNTSPIVPHEVQAPLEISLTGWAWPAATQHFKLYDKYSDQEVVLSANASEWAYSVQGHATSIRFQEGTDGTVQRALILHTQANASPSAFHRFSQELILHWTLFARLLAEGPATLKRTWETDVLDGTTAWVGKVVLRFACLASVGPWRPKFAPFAKGLPTRAAATKNTLRRKIAKREKLVPLPQQAKLTQILDSAAKDEALTPEELEGLVALSLTFQHDARPVQLISLRTDHVRVFRDAADELVCIVSFHAAKQAEGHAFEATRQVKHEWAGLIARLHRLALDGGRSRLFSQATSAGLWNRVKAVCARHQLAVDFSAYALRHTSAQSLADAGHSRTSVKHFLMHSQDDTASFYIEASLSQARLINEALGASKLYDDLLSLADRTYVGVQELEEADEDQQIGAVVGERLVAGIGLCRTGQSACSYNPVTSCYGCQKFMPSLDRAAHQEAIDGMREQVLVFVRSGTTEESPAYRQLTRALAGAQQSLEAIDRLSKSPN